MLKIPLIDRNPNLGKIAIGVFTIMTWRGKGWVSTTHDEGYKKICLCANIGDYTVTLKLIKESDHYTVTEFTSLEKDSDMGAPYWMPAEWTLALSLKPGEKWTISRASDILALLEAHNKWSKFQGFDTAFEGKDNI